MGFPGNPQAPPVARAIDDALSDVGCHIRSTPVRPETVYDIANNRASI